MVDQGSDAEIMYPDLYKGLNLKLEDLIAYDSPLISFDGKIVIPRGQIRLPVQAGSEVVEVKVDQIKELVGSQSMARQSMAAVVLEGTKCEKLEEIVIDDNLEKYFPVGAQLPPQEKEEMVIFLKKNIDMFARNAYEAPRVDPNFIFHHLHVNPAVLPKKQPPRCSSIEYSDAVKKEVNKLKQAGAIKEVFYPEWLSNTVVVKKKNGK
ncbi:uncharacterized protein LOC142635187 [Castanea sativa]|uniref:uncharacterized protein LOC142635187 n=1 Tax=Castanea sativa TaxID=21020 RepID=UPI003F6545B7